MKYQRIKTNPLEIMGRNNGPHDGAGVTFTGDADNLPPLLDGEGWVLVEDRPTPGENQRLERELTAEKWGWKLVDLTPEEIEAKKLNAPGVDQLTIMSRLGDEKAAILESLISQLPIQARMSWQFSSQIRITHPLIAATKATLLQALDLTEAELIEILTP